MVTTGATSDNEIGKIGSSLRVAAKIRPYFILGLDGGPATAFGLASSGRIFARNAIHPNSVNRP